MVTPFCQDYCANLALQKGQFEYFCSTSLNLLLDCAQFGPKFSTRELRPVPLLPCAMSVPFSPSGFGIDPGGADDDHLLVEHALRTAVIATVLVLLLGTSLVVSPIELTFPTGVAPVRANERFRFCDQFGHKIRHRFLPHFATSAGF